MEYNTQKIGLPLPEYGRSIQNMVNHALEIKDKDERQRCANTIIEVMGNMFPHLRDVPDFKHKLWDHLAIMSNFDLEIDSPFGVVQKEGLHTRPDILPYPQKRIRFPHYGSTVERLIDEAVKLDEGDERNYLIALIANYMRKSYITWNRNSVDDEVIADDIKELSRGKLILTDEVKQLISVRPTHNQYQNRQKGRNNQRRNHK